MASVGPIDKTRDAVKALLERIYFELANAEHPSVSLFDDKFTAINNVHPMLYQDLLTSWKPMGVFANAFSDTIVAGGFEKPKLPFVYEPSVDPRREHLGVLTHELIDSIGYYLSSEWTAKYTELLDDYVLWRNQILTDAEKKAYAVALAAKTRGDVGRLIHDFYAVLKPTYYETKRQLAWEEAQALMQTAETADDVAGIIHDYCMSRILLDKGNQKYVREVPLPNNALGIANEIFEFLNEWNPPLLAITYICDDILTEDLFLPLLGEASLRRYSQTFKNSATMASTVPVSLPRRRKMLTVSAGKINLLVLYYAVRNGLPTLIFRKK